MLKPFLILQAVLFVDLTLCLAEKQVVFFLYLVTLEYALLIHFVIVTVIIKILRKTDRSRYLVASC